METAKTAAQDWSVQTADWRDYPRLSEIEKACFRNEDIWPFWDLIGILTLPGLVRIKAVAEGCMVAFIGGERDTARGRGWITTLAVMPSYRRKGIAQTLLEKCEADLAMPIVRLSVRQSNQGAIGLYESAGYQCVDRWDKYYAGGESALVFEKRVSRQS